MAVAPIKSIGIIGLMSELDKVIKVCGQSQVFHPDEATHFYSDTKNFVPIADKNPYSEFLSELEDLLQMAGIKPEYTETRRFKVNEAGLRDYLDGLDKELGGLIREHTAVEQQMEQCRRSLEETSHFFGMDLEMDKINACRFIKANFGRLPKESYQKLDAYSDNPYLVFFPCTSDETHYWGVYIAPVEKSDDIDRIFSALYFEHYEISGMDGTPEQHFEKLQGEFSELEKRFEETSALVEEYKKQHLGELMRYYSKLKELDTCYSVKKYVLKYHKSFILVGWIPAEEEEQMLQKLNAVNSVECTVSDGKDELKHIPPTRLKNNFFARPYEFFVDMFGLPSYNEIDPTPFVAITFTILFGIMFGDLGQGLVVSVVGYLMWKLKKMAIGKILIPCGISSAIFGCVYGSVFGFENALDPVYHALGMEGKPVEVMESATMLLIMAISIGVVLICCAMFLNIYSSLRRRDFENGIFGPNGVAGFVFYASLIAAVVCEIVLQIHIVNLAYILVLIVVPLILMFLREPLGRLTAGEKNWQPEKWGEYCVQNFFELFEMLLSYVTNTMSFLRVGAFVLVHAGMMIVVFTLSDLAGKVLGAPGYIIFVVLGNGLIMALEALLVSIQVLRLEYYEMFSRFYLGSGRKFEPVRVKRTD